MPSPLPFLISLRDLATRLHVNERTIRRWIAGKTFPPPMLIGSALRWRESDILAWLDSKDSGNIPGAFQKRPVPSDSPVNSTGTEE